MNLIAGLLALLFGPVVYEMVHQRRWLIAFLDGFIVVSIAGLLALEVLPDVVVNGGWWSILFVAFGLLGPTLGERLFHQHARQMHMTTLLLGAAGLILHTIVDGAILNTSIDAVASHARHGHAHGQPHEGLTLAVLLHRLPVGLAVWWVLRPSLGLRAGIIAVALMAVGTLGGYWLAGQFDAGAFGDEGAFYGAWLQAFVAGTILHVVLYRPHLHDHKHPMPDEVAVVTENKSTGWAEGWGNCVGLLLLISLFWLLPELNAELNGAELAGTESSGVELVGAGHAESLGGEKSQHAEHAEHVIDAGDTREAVNADTHEQTNAATTSWLDWQVLYQLAAVSAPALLIAYLLGGIISIFMPESNLNWLKRGGAAMQAAKGVAIGLPLPICSCGVVPLYRTFVDKGVPPAAAMAFLIATPEIGLDAILLSFPLLGLEMTLARIAAAAAMALIVGWGVGRWITKTNQAKPTKSCCSKEHDHADHQAENTDDVTFAQKVKLSLREGLIKLVDNTAPWILFGLILAAAAQPILSQSWLSELPAGVEVVLFGLIGMPVYVCATGATPLVAVFLVAGVSPGAGIAFLLTGPATNVTTFGVLKDLHGAKAAMAFALVAGASAIILGLIVNQVLPNDLGLSQQDLHDHGVAWWQNVALVLLMLLFAGSVIRKGLRAFVGSVFSMPGH